MQSLTTQNQILVDAAALIERIRKAEQQLKHVADNPLALESAKTELTDAYRARANFEALYPWIWLSSSDVRSLVKAIASMAEKSYRRGIQQGEAMNVSTQDASWFRYECRLPEEKRDGLYRFSIPSPEDGYRRKIHRKWWSCVDLLDRELPYCGCNQKHPFAVLRRLTDWYQERFGRDTKRPTWQRLDKGFSQK
jgi:hypothetical protein